MNAALRLEIQPREVEAATSPSSNVFCLRPLPAVPKLPPIAPVNDLLASDSLVLPEELVQGLLHRGTKALVGGSSKAGKTWLLLDLAVCVATGSPFLGSPTTAGRVLYLNLEIQPAFFKARLQTLLKRKGLDRVDQLDQMTLRGQDTDAATLIPTLAGKICHERYSLIVIDPIYKLMGARSENASTGVGSLCQCLEQLVVSTGAAVVSAHHFTKGNQAGKKAMDRLSGSGVFARDADTVLTLTEHQAEGCFVVESTLRNLPSPAPFVVEWQFPLMVRRDDLDPWDLHRGQAADGGESDGLLLSLLVDQPLTSTGWQKLAEHAGVSRATFYRAKARLEASGKVFTDRQSKKHLPQGAEVSPETGETGETPATALRPLPTAPNFANPVEPLPCACVA